MCVHLGANQWHHKDIHARDQGSWIFKDQGKLSPLNKASGDSAREVTAASSVKGMEAFPFSKPREMFNMNKMVVAQKNPYCCAQPPSLLGNLGWSAAGRSDIHMRGFSCCSVAQLCSTLCDPKDCNTPGFPVLHHLLEIAQIHVHWVGDAIRGHSEGGLFPTTKQTLVLKHLNETWA